MERYRRVGASFALQDAVARMAARNAAGKQRRKGSSAPLRPLAFALLAAVLPGLGGAYASGTEEKDQSKTVVVWTYDSFVSEWGPGPAAVAAFREKTGYDLQFVAQGDGAALVSRVLEANARGAKSVEGYPDVALGFDANLIDRLTEAGALTAYKPVGADRVPRKLVVDPSWKAVPYDYGQFALIYDSQKIPSPPKSLEDLAAPAYRRSIILMDPRTSTPGLGFLAWTMARYGDGWRDYWKRLAPSILTIADGWDSGYGLFTSGEAPMVLSYTTSPAYHVEYDKTDRYRAAVFPAGHPAQIEAAGILAGAPNPAGARAFMDFMLSDAFQSILPLTNWMYPVVDGVALPASYDFAPKPPLLEAPVPTQADLDAWAKVVTEERTGAGD